VKRLGTRIHAALYRRSSGRLLGRMGGQPVMLLETVGRRSGRRRETPVQYLESDEAFAVVAANAGAAHPPAWYLNLSADPRARARLGARTIDVQAREVIGEERVALWRRLVAANRYLERTARKAGRELPLLLLERGANYVAASGLTALGTRGDSIHDVQRTTTEPETP
jgi:deazaflavin-dependent oxidoreductase (nitroreductase family)